MKHKIPNGWKIAPDGHKMRVGDGMFHYYTGEVIVFDDARDDRVGRIARGERDVFERKTAFPFVVRRVTPRRSKPMWMVIYDAWYKNGGYGKQAAKSAASAVRKAIARRARR